MAGGSATISPTVEDTLYRMQCENEDERGQRLLRISQSRQEISAIRKAAAQT